LGQQLVGKFITITLIRRDEKIERQIVPSAQS
jgi:hypothetical protein